MVCGVNTRVLHSTRILFWQPLLLTASSVDYILFIQAKVDLDINSNEVQAYKYVNPDELKKMMRDEKLSFTPWFRLICDTMLYEWWENLDSLDSFMNETQIRRM